MKPLRDSAEAPRDAALPGRRLLAPFGRSCAAVAWRLLGRPFDQRRGVDTGEVQPLSEFAVAGDKLAHATEHAPTSVRGFWLSVGSLAIDFRRFGFVDLGSGKGRALLLATQLPFRSIEGIELSRELHEIASVNVRTACKQNDRNRVQLHQGDAASYEFPEYPLVVYLFNPFGPPVLSSIARKLELSFRQHPRPIFVVYMNPVHRDEFKAPAFQALSSRWFDPIAQTPFVIYRMAERSGSGQGSAR